MSSSAKVGAIRHYKKNIFNLHVIVYKGGKILSSITPGKFLWLDGKLMPWDDAKIHVTTPKYWGVFEGIRAYPSAVEPNELYIFRWDAHMKRFKKSVSTYHIPLKYTIDDLEKATIETFRACDFHGDVHFYVEAFMTKTTPPFVSSVAIYPRSYPTHLPPSKDFIGKTAIVSSWRRVGTDALPVDAKCWSNYGNSALASLEALRQGVDYAILLDRRGFVSEFTGANIAIVKRGKIYTPPLYASILDGITRDSLLEFVPDLGLKIEERDFTRVELCSADEVFGFGSGWEIMPIKEIDGITIGTGDVGPVTQRIGQYYHDIVQGKVSKYKHWLLPVYKIPIRIETR